MATGSRGKYEDVDVHPPRIWRSICIRGLWDSWRTPEGDSLRTCTIITTTPNELLREIHNRMPVILQYDAYGRWLDPATLQPEETAGLLIPYPAFGMTAHAVSKTVNSAKNDSAECIQLVEY